MKKNLSPLPLYGATGHFMTGMAAHSPFILTTDHLLCDLDTCIIGTTWPYAVARVHTFLTNCDRTFSGHDQAQRNATRQQSADRAEAARLEFMERVDTAQDNLTSALVYDFGDVRSMMEDQGRTYDVEFDEARLIAKVPGLNVYLELLGCMDSLEGRELSHEQIDDMMRDQLQQMSIWYPTTQQRRKIERLLTDPAAPQLRLVWRDTYDPDARPLRPRPMGLTDPAQLDTSRHPEMQYAKLSYRDGRNTSDAIASELQKRRQNDDEA